MMTKLKKQEFTDIYISVLLVLFLIFLVSTAIPIESSYILNYDEGNELTRYYLFSKGYTFYQGVWSDHPLGMPLIMNGLSNFFDINLISARKITLLFSATNILCLYWLIRQTCSRMSSTLACLMLVTSYYYVIVSGVFLKEIPCVAISMLSLVCMFIYSKCSTNKRLFFLVLSAFFFVFSLEVKLASITMLVPLLVVGVSSNYRFPQKIIHAIFWLFSVFLITFILSNSILPFSYDHIFGVHTEATSSFTELNNSNLTLTSLLKVGFLSDTVYFILAVASVSCLLLSESRIKFLPAFCWLSLNLIRFVSLQPVWPHYYIHLAIPAAWCIGILLNQIKVHDLAFHKFPKRSRNVFWIISSLTVLLISLQFLFKVAQYSTVRNPRRYTAFRNPTLWLNMQAKERQEQPVEAFLEKYKNSGKLILTDNSYYISTFQLETPPEAAIISGKRRIAENIDGQYILDIAKMYKPDFILLERFSEIFLESNELKDFLNKNYKEKKINNLEGVFFVKNQQSSSTDQNSQIE